MQSTRANTGENMKHLARLAIVALILNFAAPAVMADQHLNAVIIQAARTRVGKKVGSGQCTDLALYALKVAGARTTFDYGVSGANANYVWGQPLTNSGQLMAGDVLQFRNARFVTTTYKKGPQGQLLTYTSYYTFPHHTAVVNANLGNGRLLILQQNTNGHLYVTGQVLDLKTQTLGQVWMYRPEKK